MYKKSSKSERWLKWLTWFLTVLAITLLAGFLITFFRLRGTLSTEVRLSEYQELGAPRNIAQLQRELLRLQYMIVADDEIAVPSHSLNRQRNLVESRIDRLENDGLLRFIDDETELKLRQIRTEWNALQPDLDSLEREPQNKAYKATLSHNLSSTELLANDAIRLQSFFMAGQRTQIERELQTNSLRLGINNFLGIGTLASALGLYVLLQQQKRKVMEQLKVREQRLQTIVKTIPDVIIRIDYTGRVVDHEPNEQADLGKPLFQPEAKSMIGSTLDELMRPQLAHEFRQKLQAAFTTGKSVCHEFWLDRYSDGNQAWFQASATPINEAEAIVAIRDITEDKQHRVAVQKAQRMESLGMMAGGVAHDFGNALTTIHINASMLKNKLMGQDGIQKYAIAVSDAAEDAYNLTNQLLVYAGKGELEATQINLNHFLNEHDAIIRATVTKQKQYIVEQTKGIPSISADESHLQQMFMNLLINAKDATEKGSGRIIVRTGTVDLSDDKRPTLIGGVKIADGRYVTLEVQDNGTGISPYMHERIFEPYFSTDKGSHSGLGLSATLGMMRSHAGGIELKSVLGEGTTFCLYFPAHQKKRLRKHRHRKPLFPE